MPLSPDSSLSYPFSVSMKESSLLSIYISYYYFFLTPGHFCHELQSQRKRQCSHRKCMLFFLHCGDGVAHSCTGLIMSAPGDQSLFGDCIPLGISTKRILAKQKQGQKMQFQSLTVIEHRLCQIFACCPWIWNRHRKVANWIARLMLPLEQNMVFSLHNLSTRDTKLKLLCFS